MPSFIRLNEKSKIKLIGSFFYIRNLMNEVFFNTNLLSDQKPNCCAVVVDSRSLSK